MVNIADLAGSFRPKLFQRVIGDHRTIVVVNKVHAYGPDTSSYRRLVDGEPSLSPQVSIACAQMDLLPKGANMARVQHWMSAVAKKAGVNGLAEVCTVSAKTGAIAPAHPLVVCPDLAWP